MVRTNARKYARRNIHHYVVGKLGALTHRDLASIMNKDKRFQNSPYTEQSLEIRKLFDRIHVDKWNELYKEPDKVLAAAKLRTDWNDNTRGNYISLWSTFIKRIGNEFLCLPPEEHKTIYEELNTIHHDQRKSYRDAVLANQLTEVQKKKDCFIDFPTLKEVAHRYYQDTLPTFSKVRKNRDDYYQMLDSTLLMCYTLFYNVRSAWFDLAQQFDPIKENGIIFSYEDGRVYLVWNKRKNSFTRLVQVLPQELCEVLNRWQLFKLERFPTQKRLFCTHVGEAYSRSSFRQRVREAWKRLLDKPITIHDMRRSQATYLHKVDPMGINEQARGFHHSVTKHIEYIKQTESGSYDDSFLEQEQDE